MTTQIFFAGILTLQIFSKTDFIFFGIGCSLTIAAFLYIELKKKSIRPVYPVICRQIQGFIWLALRLENDQKFYEDFEESFTDKILYIWFMLSVSFNCAWLIHLFLKWLLKVIRSHHVDENSTSIIMFRYITDRELIENLLIRCFNQKIRFLNISMTRYITKIKKNLTKTRTNKIPKIISYLPETVSTKCFIVLLFCLVTLLGYGAYKLIIFIGQHIIAFNETSSLSMQFVLLFVSLCIFLTVVAVIEVVMWFIEELLTNLFQRIKYFLIFLIVFIADYCFISIVLYFLGSILPFDKVNVIYALLGFLLFSFTCIKMIISIL